MKILSANCIRETANYLPQNSFWVNRPFVDLTNRNEKICLTLDCRVINRNSPGKYRTKADNLKKQTCYFSVTNNDKLFKVFLSKRIKNSEAPNNKINFQIELVRSRIRNTDETFDASSELENIISNGASISDKVEKNKAAGSLEKQLKSQKAS